MSRFPAGLALCGVAIAAATAAGPAPTRYLEGPPPGFSGGFGEDSCYACHFSGVENESPGELTIDGIPERYEPGRSYPLVVTLRRAGMRAAGFQLTARFEGSGDQAGGLTTAEEAADRVSVTTDRGVDYASQSERGAAPATADSTRWIVLWTAPVTEGAVRFDAAANAADGDGTAEGDRVYTTSALTSCPQAADRCRAPR